MSQLIWDKSNPLIIAEAGINHNGDVNLAFEMINVAKKAGADVIKFQTFKANEFIVGDTEFTYQSQGKTVTETQMALFKRNELSKDNWQAVKNKCDEVGITFMSTPQNSTDLDLLIELGIPAIKVGSDDLVNTPLIEDYASRGLPLILSSGMAYLEELDRAVRAAGWPNKTDVAMLVCTSRYPTPDDAANIQRVTTLQKSFPGLTVGFSDHTAGNLPAVVARTLGARIFEKHFTLDKNLEGPDHWFSPNPEELTAWVAAIRNTDAILGHGRVEPDSEELEMRELAHRTMYAAVDIEIGTQIKAEFIKMRRPKGGLEPYLLPKVLGKKAAVNIAADTPITFDILN